MKLTIGHLFYDLLNLYGENGNVTALKNALEMQNIEVEIKNLSINNEPWDLDSLDIVYIGAGTENNLMLALDALMKYKDVINQLILNNKLFIATGNSIELFGKTIKIDENSINALGIFDYSSERTKKRIVAECVFNYDEIEDKILGFENHESIVQNISNPLFTVEKGFGCNLQANYEGFREKNFIGTYLLGPLLVRNPKLLEKLCKEVILFNDPTFIFKDFNFTLEQMAHDKFLTKYNKD